MSQPITVVAFRPEFASAFSELNRAWIERFFTLEESDWKVLRDPENSIIKSGGEILFALDGGVAIGTVAAIPTGNGTFELAKMAVTDAYQGRGIGELLGRTLIDWANTSGATMLHLETNHVLDSAIRLYERLGFVHAIPSKPSEYVRGDVYMELVLNAPRHG
ncbi:MAG: GNAT family N-acetyltransferase [Gemmatimonadaceae bacterium]